MIIKCVAHSLNLALLTQKEKKREWGKEGTEEEAAKRNDTDINFPHEKAAVTIYVVPPEGPKKGPTEFWETGSWKGAGGGGGGRSGQSLNVNE